jgi:hypothetical protein
MVNQPDPGLETSGRGDEPENVAGSGLLGR